MVLTDSEIFPGKVSSLIRESHDYLQWPFEPGPLVLLLAEVSPGFYYMVKAHYGLPVLIQFVPIYTF